MHNQQLIMKKIEYILLLTAWLISFSGCVKEDLDLSDCPPVDPGVEEENERYLRFQVKNNSQGFANIVEYIQLFAYDENNGYIKDTLLTRNQIQASDYRFNMTAWKNEGEEFHHMIGVMNLTDNYSIDNEHHKLEFRKSVVTNRTDTVDVHLEDVYLGQIEFGTPVKSVTYDMLYLVKNTNDVHLEIEFMEGCQLPENSTITPYLRGSNGTYNAFNESVGENTLVYEHHTYLTNLLPVLHYQFTTLKMYIGDDLEVLIKRYEDENAESVQEVSFMLTEYISQLVDGDGYYLYSTDEDLELQEDPFVVRILLDCDFAIAEITVNNWFVIKPGVDL